MSAFTEYGTNPFSEYGFVEQQAWEGRKAQLKAQSVETEYHTEVGKGFIKGDASIEKETDDNEVTQIVP